ncbi:PAS domain-containing protein [Thalassotalea sp. M1531]|uniref:histidine kinase n=1 Tax=Thalassotalea algicola TaxID=2716224 RepID=A0A7Y0LAI6_9GAMM|nr:ATP-binding protein [Thalassotalea algicola]NMP30689.1 PAS domain-containing protein [Thalassotalea algicola]
MAKQLQFERQLLKYLLVATLVPAIALVIALWYYGASRYLIGLIILSLTCLTGFCATTLYQKITFQLRTLSNLLEGMVHGDYSLRGRRGSSDTNNALGQLINQINALADTLLAQRYTATESQLLVAKIIQHIDVSIIAVDDEKNIAFVNPAAEKLLNITESSVIGSPLEFIGGKSLLEVNNHDVVNLEFAGQIGRYQVICDQYREQGHQHQLFFITDVNLLLREQERQAWQDLIRVLSHEINNSLSPIGSLANTLQTFTKKIEDKELSDNFNEGLTVISERATSLSQFIQSYRQLTHLPAPKKTPTNIGLLLAKLPILFKRQVTITCSDDLTANIDPVQIEQVLINLLKNADEASGSNLDKSIEIIVSSGLNDLHIQVIDQGVGLSNSKNLFTPFYTTKKQGSGIGLVLSRQIVEAHQGQLTLQDRKDGSGCIATIQLLKGSTKA